MLLLDFIIYYILLLLLSCHDARTYINIYVQILQCMSPTVVVRVINGSINYVQSDDVDNKTEIQFPSWSLFTVWK